MDFAKRFNGEDNIVTPVAIILQFYTFFMSLFNFAQLLTKTHVEQRLLIILLRSCFDNQES